MSNFTPLVTKEYEFENDKVTVTFARMNRKDVLSTLPSIQKLKVDEDDDSQVNSLLDEMEEKALKYVRSVDGLTNSEGEPIDKETLFTEFYFISLASNIIKDLLSESVVREGNE